MVGRRKVGETRKVGRRNVGPRKVGKAREEKCAGMGKGEG